MNRNKRDFVFHEFYFYQRVRHLGAFIPNPRRLRISGLPHLRLPCLLRHRTVRPPESHDVVRSRVFHLLDLHLHRSGIVREGRRFLRPGLRRRGVLLPVLCVLRHGRARRAVAISYRDKCFGDANQR